MSQRVNLISLSKGRSPEGPAKASLNRANIDMGLNPKPSDLAMSRVKEFERILEARTRMSFNSLG